MRGAAPNANAADLQYMSAALNTALYAFDGAKNLEVL